MSNLIESVKNRVAWILTTNDNVNYDEVVDFVLRSFKSWQLTASEANTVKKTVKGLLDE